MMSCSENTQKVEIHVRFLEKSKKHVGIRKTWKDEQKRAKNQSFMSENVRQAKLTFQLPTLTDRVPTLRITVS